MSGVDKLAEAMDWDCAEGLDPIEQSNLCSEAAILIKRLHRMLDQALALCRGCDGTGTVALESQDDGCN